jgi:hypothetical protein
MDEKVGKVKIVWKSQAAINAFEHLSSNAYLERRTIDNEISDSKHSLYEKIVLRMQSAKMFQDLIGIAYQIAMSVESSALNNQAVIARMFVDEFEDD